MDLSLRLLADASMAKSAFSDLGTAALAAGQVIADFAKDCVKEFAEAERAQKQLQRVAGDLTPALERQAEAMSQAFAVQDEDVKKVQTLLLTYGAAPAQIEATTRALFDYAALTGNSVVSATTQLIHGVESGTGSIRKMGVEFESTGKFTKDLTKAVENLNSKVGGAAEADADTLAGRTRRAVNAWDDLKKSFGGFIGAAEQKVGVMQGISNFLRDWGDHGFIEARTRQAAREGGIDQTPEWQARLKGMSGETWREALKGKLPDELPSTPLGGEHSVGSPKKDKDAAEKRQEELEKALNVENEYLDKKWKAEREAEKRTEELLEEELNSWNKTQDYKWTTARKAEAKEREAEEKRLKDIEHHLKEEERLSERHAAEQKRQFDAQIEKWRQAGDQMGAALVEAIGTQLQRLAAGGDVDPAEMAGDVVATVLGIAGFAIGTYFGAPTVGGAIGGLAGSLAKAGIVSQWGKKKHDGGWIERFHGGGWPMGADEVPIIAQSGERVLSRSEVSNMGGPRGVEAAARGRGPQSVTVNAIDSQSFLDTFGGNGGRQFFNAIRVGRGDLAPLFG